MLYIHTSNRLEHLAQALATVVKVPLSNPLEKEIIVVPSKGMERWVSMTLAEQLGVWANGQFLFIDALVWRVFKETLGYLPETSPFEREIMVWSLLEILPNWLAEPEFAELQNYLQNDKQHLKHFQLASRIAELFDQYLVYRPQWIADWENEIKSGELENHSPACWQALLWQALVKRHGTQHRAKLRADFFTNLSRLKSNSNCFKRLSVFGLSALPPFHLEVLAELGRIIDVHIFVMNPCKEYWGDIVSDSDIAHKTARVKGQPTTPETLYLEKGNTLLASLGKMGRDFIDMLNEYPHDTHEYFDSPGEVSLLANIQSDILHLRERNGVKKSPLRADDNSLQVHVCHSPMRQVEVLHDQLLALFEADSSLLPKDVLVMMPDLETYAPFIEAVFATVPEKTKQIPFSIADRSLRNQSALIDAFFTILELSQSRLTVNEVLSVLEIEAVQRRFELSEPDLDLIRYWVEKTGIRWGMDKVDRERRGLPALEENTWRAGLNRLLLGYALPKSPFGSKSVGGNWLFQGILPFDEIEGRDTLILGKLVAFVEKLFECVRALGQSRTLPEWAVFLTGVLDHFLSPDEGSEAEGQQIRNILSKLIEHGKIIEFDTPISREVILAYLHHYLENEPLPTNFFTGPVSFSALLPMRSIPFKVICLLGMEDQAYPRSSKALGFDLIAKHPRRGDRSRRQNDRYLFLEVLLSAREYFYISYVGHSIHDNTVMPPSVLVSELIDYVRKNFTGEVLERLIIHHPLQAFSPRYFNHTEKSLFSFSREYCSASRAMLKERQAWKNFITEPLSTSPPVSELKSFDIKYLSRFFTNPTEFLLKECLGIQLQAGNDLLDENEPFQVQGLERYQFNQTLVERRLAGVDLTEYQTVARAEGYFPLGKIGDYTYSKLVGQIQPFVEQVQRATQSNKMEPVLVNLRIADVQVIGRLSRLWNDKLVHYRCAKIKAKDIIQLWIDHLILNCMPDQNLPRHSLLIGEDGGWEYQPVSQSEDILQMILTSYFWPGMTQPLYFFPESSLTFAQALNNGKTEKEACYRAFEKWRGNEFIRGEADNEYYRLCFGHTEEGTPLEDDRFKELAQLFFKPLLAHIQPVTF